MIPNDADWQQWIKNEIEYERILEQKHTKEKLLEYKIQHSGKQLPYYVKWGLVNGNRIHRMA